ncbi:MAG: hypothetical protein ACKN9Y_02855 [Bacteroidota bacterium]
MIAQDIRQSFQQHRFFRWLIYFSAIIVLIKLLALFILPITPHAIEDWYIANNIAHGNGFSLSLGPTALKTPVYPLFLLPFALIGSIGITIASIVQHILWFFAVIAFMRACAIRFGNRFSTISGFIFAFHPAYLYYPFVLETTALSVPLLIFYWYYAELQKQTNQYSIVWMIGGFIIGLCQPILLPAIFVLHSYFAKPFTKKKYITLILSAIIVFTPWTIRNALTFHQFIPMKSPMWMNVYEGMTKSLSEADIAFIESARTMHNDVQMEEYYKQVAITHITENPAQYVKVCLHRFEEFWLIPDRYSHRVFEPGILISRIIPQVTLMITTIIGLVILILRKHTLQEHSEMLWIMTGTLLYVSLIYALTQAANIRFKLDVEWLQIVLLFPIFKALWSTPETLGTSEG